MSPVFAHGRLRLYLLKLLDEAPRHGYEIIRLLEERFQGLYAPSAGTVYPRLAKLEQEGLVTKTSEGGRKVYRITDAGRAELTDRTDELAALEEEIANSVTQLADQIREDVRDSATDLREEIRAAAKAARDGGGGGKRRGGGRGSEDWSQWTDWRQAKEQAKAAKEEARQAREQARSLKDEVRRAWSSGDWPTGLAEGISELTRTLSGLGNPGAQSRPGPAETPADTPAWAHTDPSAEPARELERLLDRFRDEIRDTARDHGVTPAQLTAAATTLTETAARLRALLTER
jgi:DNA-binding PadR family transcriptional regulator